MRIRPHMGGRSGFLQYWRWVTVSKGLCEYYQNGVSAIPTRDDGGFCLLPILS